MVAEFLFPLQKPLKALDETLQCLLLALLEVDFQQQDFSVQVEEHVFVLHLLQQAHGFGKIPAGVVGHRERLGGGISAGAGGTGFPKSNEQLGSLRVQKHAAARREKCAGVE